jgi:vacuolar protein sorting-associated protein 13A/C
MHGFKFLLVSDVTEMAILDIQADAFTVYASDWSSSLCVSASVPLYANFFNIKNSHWEPVIEPWQVNIDVSIDVTSPSTRLIFTMYYIGL